MMNIVFVETDTLGRDIDLSRFGELGHTTFYGALPYDQLGEALADADIIIVNKAPMNESTLAGAGHAKLICVTATGTNNLDKEYLDRRGIQWRNVAGYATEIVTQHTFAMVLYLLEKLPYYDRYVKSGGYEKSPIFTHLDKTFFELRGKTWGIIGLGAIGRRVAEVARAFGCRVIYHSASGAAPCMAATCRVMESLRYSRIRAATVSSAMTSSRSAWYVRYSSLARMSCARR